MEEEWNGSEVCSTTDSSNTNGKTGLWSMPLHSDQAHFPSGPNRSASMCPPIEATAPNVCGPNRCNSLFTSAETGSRSMV